MILGVLYMLLQQGPKGLTLIKAFNKDLTSYGQLVIKEPIVAIAAEAFKDCSKVKRVILTYPKLLTSIGVEAFANCTELRSAEFPGLIEIGFAAFRGCVMLRGVDLPDSVTELPDNVFNGCSSLQWATLPNFLIRIGSYAFFNCSTLIDNSFTKYFCNTFPREKPHNSLPESLLEIGEGAFTGCTGLRDIILPPYINEGRIGLPQHVNYSKASMPTERLAIINDFIADFCIQCKYSKHSLPFTHVLNYDTRAQIEGFIIIDPVRTHPIYQLHSRLLGVYYPGSDQLESYKQQLDIVLRQYMKLYKLERYRKTIQEMMSPIPEEFCEKEQQYNTNPSLIEKTTYATTHLLSFFQQKRARTERVRETDSYTPAQYRRLRHSLELRELCDLLDKIKFHILQDSEFTIPANKHYFILDPKREMLRGLLTQEEWARMGVSLPTEALGQGDSNRLTVGL